MKYIKQRKLNEEKTEFQIPDIIWELNDIFNKNGHKLYVVGGAVRDFITGDTPKDFDLCTDAIPEKVIEMLESSYRVKLQGEAFGVVVVYPEGEEEMEIATFREDVTKGRNPEVKIGGVTIEQDVKRRDLTFNALFYDLETKEIVDLVGGQSDLKNKIVRMVGDPMERIEEDPLRILRVFRFACRYGSKLDEKTIEAIHANNDISSISKERIFDSRNGEFMKSFKQSKDFQQYLDFLTEFDLWEQILPGIKINDKIENQENLTIVMAQLLRENNSDKQFKKILNRCAVPGYLIEQTCFLLELLNFDKNEVVTLYKTKVRLKVHNKTIDAWFKLNNIQHYDTIKFINYTPSIKSQDVMEIGRAHV